MHVVHAVRLQVPAAVHVAQAQATVVATATDHAVPYQAAHAAVAVHVAAAAVHAAQVQATAVAAAHAVQVQASAVAAVHAVVAQASAVAAHAAVAADAADDSIQWGKCYFFDKHKILRL